MACHGSGSWSPASHCGDLGSITGQPTCDLWWKELHWSLHLHRRSAVRRGTAAFALRMQETKVRLASPVACSHFDLVTRFGSLVSVTKLWWGEYYEGRHVTGICPLVNGLIGVYVKVSAVYSVTHWRGKVFVVQSAGPQRPGEGPRAVICTCVSGKGRQ